MRLADVIGRDIPSLSTPTVTAFPGADLNDANVFGSPAKLVDLNTFGDGISHSLSDLNLLRPLHGDKQVGTGGENPGPQSPPGGRTTPRSLTDGFKFTAPKVKFRHGRQSDRPDIGEGRGQDQPFAAAGR